MSQTISTTPGPPGPIAQAVQQWIRTQSSVLYQQQLAEYGEMSIKFRHTMRVGPGKDVAWSFKAKDISAVKTEAEKWVGVGHLENIRFSVFFTGQGQAASCGVALSGIGATANFDTAMNSALSQDHRVQGNESIGEYPFNVQIPEGLSFQVLGPTLSLKEAYLRFGAVNQAAINLRIVIHGDLIIKGYKLLESTQDFV